MEATARSRLYLLFTGWKGKMEKKEDICYKCSNRNNCSTFVFKPADPFYRIAKCCFFVEEAGHE